MDLRNQSADSFPRLSLEKKAGRKDREKKKKKKRGGRRETASLLWLLPHSGERNEVDGEGKKGEKEGKNEWANGLSPLTLLIQHLEKYWKEEKRREGKKGKGKEESMPIPISPHWYLSSEGRKERKEKKKEEGGGSGWEFQR